ncbi:MAG TPA: hypothetical protein VIZ22_05640 [Candidatus Limnocylindrales bacterium]
MGLTHARQRPYQGRPWLALLAALFVATCGGSSATPGASAKAGVAPTPTVGDSAAAPTPTNDEASARFGFGPQPDTSITYQPDVVVIGGGPASIRGVSADGLTWTVDAAAAGMDRLAPGLVMFATGKAVGRVIAMDRQGDATDVTLAPVGLGEIIKDGHLTFDQRVPLDALAIAEVPSLADGIEDISIAPPSGVLPGEAPASGARATLARSVETGPVATATNASESQASTKVGKWAVTAYRTEGTVGLRAEQGVGAAQVSGADLKVALDAHIEVSDLRVVADIPVTRGEVGTSHFRVFGIKGLVMTVEGGAVNGLASNRKARVEIPIKLSQNVIIGGFPATLTQTFRFLVETAFTAKNGTLTAVGGWDVDGSIGIDGQTVTLPTMTARSPSLVDSIAGISVGVNGMVVAVSFEFGLMAGIAYAGAGPFAALITSLGLTNGSSLGIVHCRQASITATVSAGVGVRIFDPVNQALKKLLKVDIPAKTTLATADILQERWASPDVEACR